MRCFRHVHQEDLAAAAAAKAKPGEGLGLQGGSPRKSLAGGLLWRTSSQLGRRERSASQLLEDGSGHEVQAVPALFAVQSGHAMLFITVQSGHALAGGEGTLGILGSDHELLVMPRLLQCRVSAGGEGIALRLAAEGSDVKVHGAVSVPTLHEQGLQWSRGCGVQVQGCEPVECSVAWSAPPSTPTCGSSAGLYVSLACCWR